MERKEIVMAKSFSYHHETTKNGETKSRGASYETGRGLRTYSSTTPAKNEGMSQNKKVAAGVGGGIAGVVGLIVAGVKLAKKLTEAKAANRRKDLDDSFRGSANIAAGIAEQEEQEDFKNQW